MARSEVNSWRTKLTVFKMQRVMMTCNGCLHPSCSSGGQRRFLGLTSFSFRDLLRSKDPHVAANLRTAGGAHGAGEATLCRLQMERESGGGDEAPPGHEFPALCERLHGSVHDKDNSPTMRAVLCAQVCKVYRFQTEDQRWLLVREELWETPLCFSLPKQLLSALIQEHTNRVQEVTELGDLSPHWDGLRRDVIDHCDHLIGCYREALAELDGLSASSSFKSSSAKSERHLQFVPTNLHAQRMEVTDPGGAGAWYDVVTFGAPADHHHAFKHGGLKRLMGKRGGGGDPDRPSRYSADESARAGRLLRGVAQLQPLLFGLAEELLAVSAEQDMARLTRALDDLTAQTERFVHALKDELVSDALSALHEQSAADARSHVHSNGLACDPANREAGRLSPGGPRGADGREAAEHAGEEWERTWANVAKSLDCIVAMVERLRGRDVPRERSESTGETCANDSASGSSWSSAGSWQEQLLPLVLTLRDCVREAVAAARPAMTFVVLRGAAAPTVDRGPAHVAQRRHAVFSQALAALVCGFVLKLNAQVDRQDFLRQLLAVGLLAEFESLLSTYGDEVGMLEDMEVGVADLSGVSFAVSQAQSEGPDHLLPTLSGTWGSFVVEVPLPPETFASLPRELREGRLIGVHPVLFNIGINQHQSLAERFGDSSPQERLNHRSCERLRVYCDALRRALPDMACVPSLPSLLASLDASVDARKKKNVEVLWTAAAVCRQVGGVRLTSCKSAKDRTAMSVTLEQCALLRERHALSPQHFGIALDCMRRDGCRMENVEKNVGCRKFAFSGVQLLTFPKLYRPPDGSYGQL